MSLLLALALAADTLTYPVMNHGRPAGEMRVVRDADSVVVTYSHIDRNRGRWLQNRYTLGGDGLPVAAESRPMTRDGVVSAATSGYRVRGDSVTFQRAAGSAQVRPRAGGLLSLSDATPIDLTFLARQLLRTEGRTGTLLPSDRRTQLVIAADTVVRHARGTARVRLAMFPGPAASPRGVWIDADGGFVAGSAEWFIPVHPDYVDAMPTLRTIELDYRRRLDATIAAQLRPAYAGSVVIENADVFDAESGAILPGYSIAIADGRITAVAPSRGFRVPRGARRINARGRTVIPGMWDMHAHVFAGTPASRSLADLANGITVIRDMAADTDIATALRDRANALQIVAPHVVLAGFLEGPQAWRGPSDVLVSTEGEARDVVARYAALGYKQVKLYNLVHPDLVPTIVDEARKHGMRVSGHVPRGLTVNAAIRLGFNEINHAAFLFSTFHQDSLYVPEMRAYSLVASIVAPRTDVDGAPMTALIDDLKKHGTVIDGTFNLWMRPTTGADSLDARAGNAAYLRLIKRLYDAGVTMVPGTDNSSYHAELMQYERAGIPAPTVLQMATLTSARVMGLDAEMGSIAVGKVADLVIVDGKPHERIEDLRNIQLVFRAGRGYEPSALTEQLGRAVLP
jgi:imidazolonepropionase-like amidohydrolase